jgi:hypothetical protein
VLKNRPIFGFNVGGTYSNVRGSEAIEDYNYDLDFLVGGLIEIP